MQMNITATSTLPNLEVAFPAWLIIVRGGSYWETTMTQPAAKGSLSSLLIGAMIGLGIFIAAQVATALAPPPQEPQYPCPPGMVWDMNPETGVCECVEES